MTQPASVGTLSKCAFSLANTFGAGSAQEYREFGLKLRQELYSTDGIRGTHSHPVERTRLGRITCSGAITLQPGKADLDLLLPLITGTPKSAGNTFLNTSGLLNETLTPFFIVANKMSGVYTYAGITAATAGCVVDSATFHIAEGEALTVTLNVEAINEYPGAAGSFPVGATFNFQAPYMWSDCSCTIQGSTYWFKEATITWNNNVKKDRYMNSIYRTDLPFLDRIVTVTLRTPNTSDQAALLAYPGITAQAFNLTATVGSASLSIASSALLIEPEGPDLPGREESLLPIHGRLYTSSGGTVAECTITNVST
jgi:hypothetical protein